MSTPKRTVGRVTTGALSGAGLAGAATVVLVWILGENGIEIPSEVGAAIAALITGLGTLIGGYLPRPAYVAHVEDLDVETAVEEITEAAAPVADEPSVDEVPDGEPAGGVAEPDTPFTATEPPADDVEPDAGPEVEEIAEADELEPADDTVRYGLDDEPQEPLTEPVQRVSAV